MLALPPGRVGEGERGEGDGKRETERGRREGCEGERGDGKERETHTENGGGGGLREKERERGDKKGRREGGHTRSRMALGCQKPVQSPERQEAEKHYAVCRCGTRSSKLLLIIT